VELFVSTLFNVTGTPASTAADGSVTTPEMLPVVAVCPQTLATVINANKTESSATDLNKRVVTHFCWQLSFISTLQFSA
jgi:hypothetical protein